MWLYSWNVTQLSVVMTGLKGRSVDLTECYSQVNSQSWPCASLPTTLLKPVPAQERSHEACLLMLQARCPQRFCDKAPLPCPPSHYPAPTHGWGHGQFLLLRDAVEAGTSLCRSVLCRTFPSVGFLTQTPRVPSESQWIPCGRSPLLYIHVVP